jgi:predicted permease
VLAESPARLVLEGADQRVWVRFVTVNTFAELGGTARLGRVLGADDDAAGAESAVVLSAGAFRRLFGGDPTIVGRTVRLEDRPARVVGVAADRFTGLDREAPDAWMAMGRRPVFGAAGTSLTDFGEGALPVQMWGRLRPGVEPRVAEAELTALAAELRRRHPAAAWEGETFVSAPGGYSRLGAPMVPLLALGAALGLLILVVACTNLGGLLLARGAARGPELAVRRALGAGRGRIFRQLLTESLALAGLGGVAGLGLGHAVLRALVAATGEASGLDPAPDLRVAAFAAAAALASALVFGIGPAWQGARHRFTPSRVRQVMIGAQIAASCVLVIVAGLLGRALHHAVTASPGFDYARVVSVDPGLRGVAPDAARAHLDALEARLRSVPGVASVSMATNPPLGNRWSVRPARVGARTVRVHLNAVGPEFFRTMGIPLRGRDLSPGESGVVVGESLARLAWPDRDPLGQTLSLGPEPDGSERAMTVIGVAGSARLVSPEDSDAVELYSTARAGALPHVAVLVRIDAPPETVLPGLRAAARAADPERRPEVQWMGAAFDRSVSASARAAAGAGALGLVALALACLGVVGLVASSVAGETREIGIRMALGAHPAVIVGGVLRRLAWPSAAGLAIGIGGSIALGQVLRRGLYGLSHLDPFAYASAVALFLSVTGAAALWPARAALRVDPVRALRHE